MSLPSVRVLTPALLVLASSTTVIAKELPVEQMVVTASRTEKPLATIPNTVTVIDQKSLEQQIGINGDLSSVLGNLIPSFSPSRQKLSNSGESLRGRKPLYLIDGVPQSNPLRDGGRDGNTISPLMLERVEVIHGANAIHGLGAAGGIINLITKRPSDTPEHSLKIGLSGQEEELDDSLGYSGSYSFSGSFEQFDLLASVAFESVGVGFDADGQVVGFDTTQGDTMDSENLDTFLKIGKDFENQRLEFTYNRYEIEGETNWVPVNGDVDAGIPTTAVEGTVEGDAPKNEVTTISLSYRHDQLLGHSLRAQLFKQDFAGTYGGGRFGTFQDPAFGADIFDQSENQSEKYGLKLTLNKDELAGLPLALTYGLDVFQDQTQQKLVQTGRAWVPESTYKNYAPFLQFEYSGIEQLTVTTGVRHEVSELEVDDFTTLASYGSQEVTGGTPDFSETLYNMGASYQINDVVRLYGNYAESFSMPDVGRVLRGIDQPNQSVETFLDLTPISTENSEIGVEFNIDNIRSQITYYQSESDFGQRLQANADGIFSVQREKTDIDGIELRIDWLASNKDLFGIRYAKTRGEYDSNDDGKVDTDLDGRNIAPDRINLSWERDWTDTVSTRLQFNRLLNRNFKDLNNSRYESFEGYTTIDVSAEWQASVGTFTLGVQNLNNQDYFTYYSQAGGGSAARNFKGYGRSIRLSYERHF